MTQVKRSNTEQLKSNHSKDHPSSGDPSKEDQGSFPKPEEIPVKKRNPKKPNKRRTTSSGYGLYK